MEILEKKFDQVTDTIREERPEKIRGKIFSEYLPWL